VRSFCGRYREVTDLRIATPWLLFLLPAGGVAVGLLYHRFGRDVESGSNLIVDEIHEPGGGVPSRIAPLAFLGTIVTHLFGRSAGREGTAVQMGGGIASAFARRLDWLSVADTRTLLMTGVVAGFAGVFGTPLAATVFAMEVLAIGRISYQALLPCLAAAIIADWVCGAWGVGHTPYHIATIGAGAASHLDLRLLSSVAPAGVLFGLATRLFSEVVHAAQHGFKSLVKAPALRPALGGVAVIALALLFGRDYLGIGVTAASPDGVSIVSAFEPGDATAWSWLLKLLFTVVTLGSGFKGGEVTPLFFIGATLGNALAVPLHVPVDLIAGLGFVAVFAAAANTPLACTIMAVELFGTGGGPNVVYFATACFMAYLCSGNAGIYLSQRIATPKLARMGALVNLSLREARQVQRDARAYASTFRNTHISTKGESAMKVQRDHKVIGREQGQLRIFLAAGARGTGQKGWRKILGWAPLYPS
jgi:H+/Cl- antiporter ClcA